MGRKIQYCQNVTSNVICRLSIIPIKIQLSYFVDIKKIDSKIYIDI